jgi:hypothetical protein
MPPDSTLAILATVQQAISGLLTTREPVFLSYGMTLFLSVATILICWKGVEMMLAPRDGQLYDFAEFLLFKLAFGFAMMACYESPIPGIGISFSNLITDQTAYFMTVLDARAMENVDAHLNTLWGAFVTPDAWSILANLMYWVLILIVILAKVASMFVVAGGLIFSAVCALVGPLFVPFYIVPQLDWLFWNWFKAFLQYSFMPVIALAYLMVGEQMMFRYVTTLPPVVTEEGYLVYAFQAMVVVLTFATGIAMVPMLTSSIFSGYAHASSGINIGAIVRRVK